MKNYIAYYENHAGEFVPVMMVSAKSKEEVFALMQGENWSPNGEGREHILSLGLSHTSMSVGDRIYDCQNSKTYQVDFIGFSEIPLT
jgi:hypothetical protein